MSDLARAGVSGLIDLVDHASDAVVVALKATKDIGMEGIEAPIHVGDKALEAALEEISNMQSALISKMHEVTNAVAEAIPLP